MEALPIAGSGALITTGAGALNPRSALETCLTLDSDDALLQVSGSREARTSSRYIHSVL